MPVVEVAAGIIHRDGRYLIARRKSGVHLGGFWEFPGGKREAGESLVECLQRELFEELTIRVDVPIPYRIIRHEYPEKTVELHFFCCAIEQGEAVPVDCEEIRWVLPEELACFEFPPADRVIIDALQSDAKKERAGR
ncbi:MAG: (deoxy)nucleoside triphosphate pyrophosphohydrolase [Nitrospira sp.]|nr:(deoxy)nucleoside triphosphate pyrophosphohydrolase [Nitrospira sp.]MBH0181888.1 (deoxy)nucleoside triphosphate pyrophosphohydrolase [Nitrospira sp.]MBH0185226.1 (deoxy)nucleoside triphosphate pyrophosphohydrolase [Nitrospira sp.]